MDKQKEEIRFYFQDLVEKIRQAHIELNSQSGRAVNIALTMRNWLIGCYISEYELEGADRASYGERLLENLSQKLEQLRISNCNRRQLYRYLRFYNVYPRIVGTVSPQLKSLIPLTISANQIVGTVSPLSGIDPEKLISQLSYSHIELIVGLDDETKRAFYEVECIRGNWSVRELKRQMNSLYYERSGLSTDKKKLSELTLKDSKKAPSSLDIRDPYVFEFLGLKSREVMSESQLEDELLGKIQEFLLELGHGFCFEARQKRILIGDNHYFVDLVFYHR
ncbi:MAG: DUF1016 family protein, partial [SAR324 cluster bacterium]|nr:DUF1016 family protein [SAR324 cluster bacterium]